MGAHGHHKTVCKECDRVLGTCRCPSNDKPIIYETCTACKILVAEQLEQEENNEG